MIPYKFSPLGLAPIGEPVVGSRGVFLTSAGAAVSSAMIVSGGTIGTGYAADAALVLRRGRSVSQTITAGGSMTISSGGASVHDTIESGGQAYVRYDGVAKGATVSSGGRVHVSSGGIATSAVVTSGGKVTVSSGGVATDPVFSKNAIGATTVGGIISGGLVYASAAITNSGTVYGVTILQHGGHIENRGITSNCIISGGYINGYSSSVAGTIIRGGRLNALVKNAVSNTIQSGGEFFVQYSGNASNTVVFGGVMDVRDNGVVYNTTISGGRVTISAGTASNVEMYGGTMLVSSGCLADHFSSVDGVMFVVYSGGSATTNATAYGVSVEDGGALTVESGGVLNVQSGKTAYGVRVSGGGKVNVSSGGVIYNLNNTYQTPSPLVTLVGGTAVSPFNASLFYVSAGSVVYNAVNRNGLTVFSNGVVSGVEQQLNNLIVRGGTVYDPSITGGLLTISQGGKVYDAFISSGRMNVSSAGTASAPTVLNGGTLTVLSAGSALEVVNEPDAVIDSRTGATITYAQPIPNSQGVFTSSGSTPVASAMVVSGGTIGDGYDATTMNVYNRGLALSNIVQSGGSAYVRVGGIANDNIVSAGGSMFVYYNASASSVTIAGGECFVYTNAVLSGGVMSSGFVHVWQPNASAAGVIMRNGTMYVSSGANVSDITISGGWMRVYSTGIASAPIVLNGGTLTVSSAGAALDVTSSAGAVVTVLEGGTITYKA